MATNHRNSPFLDQVRNSIRTRHYSIRTEKAYVGWIRRYILFHKKRHPKDLGEAHVAEFLTHLAVNRRVSPSTQNQALNALVFLYKQIIGKPLGDILGTVRAKRPQHLPLFAAGKRGGHPFYPEHAGTRQPVDNRSR